MLMSATIFEGYDITIFHLATPEIAKTFHLADPAIGAIVIFIVRFGGMLSFFVVILADCYGRKPIISCDRPLLHGADLVHRAFERRRVVDQFPNLVQIFLAAEFGVAVTMISEEFPDARRGRAIAALHMVAFLGATAAAFTYAIMAYLSPGMARHVPTRARAPDDGRVFAPWDCARPLASTRSNAHAPHPASRVPLSGLRFAIA